MDPAEIEFLAEKELITVVPNFAQDKLYLIGGDIEPLTPGLPANIPLWLAVSLKQKQKCRIRPPVWMDVEQLRVKKQEEIDSQYFTEMPSQHYMEVTQLVLLHAPDDIPHADETRTLLKDIWDLRQAKLRSSIDTFVKSYFTSAKINYLTLMELNTIRSFLAEALNHMHILRTNCSGDAPQQTQD